MLYDGWMDKVATRFADQLNSIETTHNFEYGPEFEMVLVEFLEHVLPERFGVCQGYVVTQDGTSAGDDIIIYDRARFPTLRVLQSSRGRKERVPAEAVVAYIEAKHTLHTVGTEGQSLAKACAQVGAVKSLYREPRPLEEIVPFVDIGVKLQVPPGFPKQRNPWYGAIIARKVAPEAVTSSTLLGLMKELPLPLPDLVVAGEIVVVPAHVVEGQRLRLGLRPTFDPTSNTLIACRVRNSFGLGIAHLLWAAELIELGGMPWQDILAETIRDGEETFVY